MDTLKELASTALVGLAPVLLTVLVAAVVWALNALREKLTHDGKASRLAFVIERSLVLAGAIVRDLEATMRPLLKEASADGKLTTEEIRRIKSAALIQLQASLKDKGLKELQEVLRIEAGQLGVVLGGFVERALDNMKAEQARGLPPVLQVTPRPQAAPAKSPGA